MDVDIVIIEDRIEFKDHAVVYALGDKYKNVNFFTTPKEGLDYISNNLEKNLIVLLDIQFPKNEKDGHEILKEIYTMSQLIPVILWSGINEDAETFSDFINNNAFGFMSKDVTVNYALEMVNKAVLQLKTSLDNTIEDWIINKQEDKDLPIYITTNGDTYSLNDILREIRTQTEVGKSFSQKLNNLTIDLLLRQKENLNG